MMEARRPSIHRTRCAAALIGTILSLSAIGATSALAASPWWHLTSGSRPTYLHAGRAKPGTPAVPGEDEVQKIVVSGAAEETWAVANMTKEEVENGEFECSSPPAPKFAAFPVGAPASLVQSSLEEVCGYGPGSVEVTGTPASEPAEYLVRFKGPLAEQPVRLLNTEVAAVAGFAGTVTATEVTPGAPAIPEIPPTPDGEVNVTAENIGDADVEGSQSPVHMRDVLPRGLKAVGVAATEPFKQADFQQREPIPCSLEEAGGVQTATCTPGKPLAPYDQIEMRLAVDVQPGASSGEPNEVSISGGGAAPVQVRRPVTISGAQVPYGIEEYELGLEEEGGASTVQAGAHPFQLTTTLALNQLDDIAPLLAPPEFRPEVLPSGLAKDLNFELPPGLIGNATAIPQCTTTQFFETFEAKENACPPGTAVGVATVTVHEPATVGTSILTEPVFNLEPRKGEPARFGFYVVLANSPVFIDTQVRSGADYGVTVDVQNVTQTAAFLSSEVSFWGVPGDSRHDQQRGWGCILEARGNSPHPPCTPSAEAHPKPFLTLPTSCSRTLSTSVESDSWADPGSFSNLIGVFVPGRPLNGCNRLQFGPQLEAGQTNTQGAQPTGMKVDVHVPQETNENAAGTASSNIRSLTVTFPRGFTVNPSSAEGLEACSEGEVGYLSAKGAEEELLFSPTLPSPFCPDAAKLGTVSITTPLLKAPLQGGLYLATPAPNGEPGKNPFESLIALYIVVEDPVSGVLVKLPGQATLDPVTGQIQTTFQNTPDLAFEDAEVDLFAGPRAPLATPPGCGTYTAQALFRPWSGNSPAGSNAIIDISSGPDGGPCTPAPLALTPALNAGTANNNAGAFGNLSTSIGRKDGDQQIKAVALHMPGGISGVLRGVTLCPEASASAGTCPANSQIGHSIVSAGVGQDPFTVTGGQVFLTEGYEGAPFGLSIVTPAVAGPFDLGNVIVRAKVQVDPRTAALTVTTDESIPQFLHGIQLDVRNINVAIDRPGFTFNPTSCNKMSITGTIAGYEGASSPVSSPFQAAGCANLAFKPKVAVSVPAHASRSNGTAVSFKISYPKGAMGSDAWFNEAKFTLPKQLPARLTTIQQACVAATFEANPAACPAGSKIGSVIVHTQLLPVPLEGSAYFVSHGGAKFPDAVFLLHGYGITIELTGETLIKNGITSATFRNTPDVPFENISVTLPAGRYSEFAASLPHESHDFCGQHLVVGTFLKASNGLQISQNSPVSVSGCPKTKTRAQKLKAALAACHSKHNKAKRRGCEAQARQRYGARTSKHGRKR